MPDLTTGVCPAQRVPVYRLFNNRRDANHRYTADINIKLDMLTRGYTAEDWDEACTAAGLVPVDRFSTWSRDVDPAAPYTVSLHRQARE